jgi:hypothetical protein
MTGPASFPEIARALVEDASYRQTLTSQLAARTVPEDVLRQLIAYARSRHTTMGQAMARRVLTDAGVSWEAL